MENIYINMRNQGTTLSNYFKDKELVDIDTLLTKFEEVLDELENVKEKYKDLKQNVKENYRPLTQAEQIGYNPRDFYEDR